MFTLYKDMFSGRINRIEYFLGAFSVAVTSVVAHIFIVPKLSNVFISNLAPTPINRETVDFSVITDQIIIMSSLSNIVTITIAILATSLAARRLHDMGVSGWWALIIALLAISNFYTYSALSRVLFDLIHLTISVALCTYAGDKDTNKYADVPTKKVAFKHSFKHIIFGK